MLIALFVKWRILWVRIKFRLCGINIIIGENVSIGRMVQIQVTDGGKINIGDGVTLQDFTLLCAQEGSIEIDNNTFIGVGSHLVSVESIKIGKNCLIAAYCVIRDANHGMHRDIPMFKQKQVSAPIKIGDDVWLGAHAVVTAGSMIATGAVIGANAVVTNDIPSFSI
ncbi:MAG: hypothetical protein A2298_02785, partial [Gammaproteobacteria bacterium RIFOXYB2_FULL_38_6]